MPNPSQHTIEYFFDKYKIKDADKKAKFLPLVTDVIYEYNMAVVRCEQEKDAYRQQQFLNDVDELEQKINDIFSEGLG